MCWEQIDGIMCICFAEFHALAVRAHNPRRRNIIHWRELSPTMLSLVLTKKHCQCLGGRDSEREIEQKREREVVWVCMCVNMCTIFSVSILVFYIEGAKKLRSMWSSDWARIRKEQRPGVHFSLIFSISPTHFSHYVFFAPFEDCIVMCCRIHLALCIARFLHGMSIVCNLLIRCSCGNKARNMYKRKLF